MLVMTGCIAYRWEGGDGSAQHGQSVIYDCLVIMVMMMNLNLMQQAG